MKKLGYLLAMGLFLGASPSYALFVNGDFENGDFTGWTLKYGRVNGGNQTISWGASNHGLRTVIDDTATMPGQTLDINPYTGEYMARLNDIYGNYHATGIWQKDVITQSDIDNGAVLYVNWGAALVEPSNDHPVGDQPFFGIEVLVGGDVIDTFYADALTKQGGGWTKAGYCDGDLWYKTGQWSLDIASYSIGTEVTINMYVADCGWGGHGGYAFLDSIGTIKPPVPDNPAVPVPGALALGICGVVATRRLRKRLSL